MKKILLLALISLFVFPMSTIALTDTQCESGGGRYESGICNCDPNGNNGGREWSGDRCECPYGKTWDGSSCVKYTPPSDSGNRYLPSSITASNCSAILCEAKYEKNEYGGFSGSTAKKQAYFNGYSCECPTGYYSSLAPTKDSGNTPQTTTPQTTTPQTTTPQTTTPQTTSPTTTNKDTGSTVSTATIDNPISLGTFADLINAVIDWIINIALVLAPLIIVYGGFTYITAAGDASKISKGRQIILYAVIGFILALLARSFATAIKDLVAK